MYGILAHPPTQYSLLLYSPVLVPSNEATLSGLEPITAVLADVPASGPPGNGSDSQSCKEKPKCGLVLGGGLPSIPGDLLKKVLDGSYVELAAFLPERIQESFLYPEGNKKKLAPIDKFTDWVLAFCSFGIATLQAHPDFGANLLTFMGTVARLARDHHGPAWATYEQAFRAKVAANPSVRWNCLDQEVWALALVPSTTSTLPQKRTSLNSKTTCNRWNEDRPCPYKVCRYLHACAGYLSPTHRVSACPMSAAKRAKGSGTQ